MNLIKDHSRHYSVVFELKSAIKDEECKIKDMKLHLENLQKKTFDISSRVEIMNWKIKQADFIFSCEKKRHGYFYSIIEKAENILTKEVGSPDKLIE